MGNTDKMKIHVLVTLTINTCIFITCTQSLYVNTFLKLHYSSHICSCRTVALQSYKFSKTLKLSFIRNCNVLPPFVAYVKQIHHCQFEGNGNVVLSTISVDTCTLVPGFVSSLSAVAAHRSFHRCSFNHLLHLMPSGQKLASSVRSACCAGTVTLRRELGFWFLV